MSVLIVVILIILAWVLVTYNSIITKSNNIEQAKASIDVYLTQRFELIPNLVECVKAYMKHEQAVMEKVTNLQKEYNQTKDLKSGAKLNGMCNRLIGFAESNPELKASEQVLNLQKSLAKMENQLQAARRLYNLEVTAYNTKIARIPTNLIAKIFGFQKAVLFELEAEVNIEDDL